MTVMRRFAQGAQYDKMYIYMGNNAKTAQLICDSMKSRRSGFSPTKMTRIISAMQVRRVQQSNQTQYAIEFDKVKLSTGALVHPLMNQLYITTPNNGRASSQRAPYTVGVTKEDYNMTYAYITSQQFKADLIDLRTFGISNSLGLVNINLANGTSPTCTYRLKDTLIGQTTLPSEWKHSEVTIYALATDEIDKFDKAKEKDEFSNRIIPPEEAPLAETNGLAIRTSLVDVSAGKDIGYQDIAITSQSDTAEFTTINEAAALVTPIFMYVKESEFLKPGADSSLFATRNVYSLEFQGENLEFTSRGVNILLNSSFKDMYKTDESPKFLGRTYPPKVDTPAYDVPPQGYDNPRKQEGESEAYNEVVPPGDKGSARKVQQNNDNGYDQDDYKPSQPRRNNQQGRGRGSQGRSGHRDTRTRAYYDEDLQIVHKLVSLLKSLSNNRKFNSW